MLDFWTQLECDALYKLSIEQLELSADTYLLVIRTGMSTVGVCIDYFQHVEDGACISAPIGFFTAMEDEVKPKLWEKGFGKWFSTEARDLLNEFGCESQIENPIEYGGFSKSTLDLLRQAGMKTMSDCADYFIHFYAGDLAESFSPDLHEVMQNEVKYRLKFIMNWS